MSETHVSALPAPRTDTLARPPLELVVCQVRHEPKSEVGEPSNALRFKAILGGDYSKLEPIVGAEFAIAPGAAQPMVNQRPQAWRLTSSDGGRIVTISPDSFAIECTRYTTWTEFRTALSAVVAAFDECFGPQICQRVGVRYVDRMWREQASTPAAWESKLDRSVLAFGGHATLAAHALTAQTVSELIVGDYRATVRASLASDQNPAKFSMLLDTDCYDDRSAAFAVNAVGETVEDLHRLNLQLFQAVLTDEYYEELKG